MLSFSLTPRLGHFVITALQMTDLVVCKAIKAEVLSYLGGIEGVSFFVWPKSLLEQILSLAIYLLLEA